MPSFEQMDVAVALFLMVISVVGATAACLWTAKSWQRVLATVLVAFLVGLLLPLYAR